jgi:hypothetical protein
MADPPQIVQPDETNPLGWVLVGDEACFFSEPKADEEISEIVARLRAA